MYPSTFSPFSITSNTSLFFPRISQSIPNLAIFSYSMQKGQFLPPVNLCCQCSSPACYLFKYGLLRSFLGASHKHLQSYLPSFCQNLLSRHLQKFYMCFWLLPEHYCLIFLLYSLVILLVLLFLIIYLSSKPSGAGIFFLFSGWTAQGIGPWPVLVSPTVIEIIYNKINNIISTKC